MQMLQIARVCHEANRALCQIYGDDSQPTWEDAPDWQKGSALQGVVHRIAHPDSGPEASHLNWLAVKEAAGWKYGPEKDVELKRHPCMRPYHDLPYDQRLKDQLFIAIVDALIKGS